MADQLNISTALDDRPKVKIDGTAYPLARLKGSDAQRLRNRVQEAAPKLEAGELTADDLDAMYLEISQMLLPTAPEDVLARLIDEEVLQILELFTRRVETIASQRVRHGPGSSASMEPPTPASGAS